MSQHLRRLALLLGVSSLMGVSVLVACSDDAAVAVPDGGFGTVGTDSGHATSSSSGTASSSSGGTGDDDDGVVDAGGADCSAAPYLHSTTKGFYCSFFKDAGPDSGSSSNCADDETCCQPGKVDGTNYGLSFCAHTDSKGDNGQNDCSMSAQGYTGQDWAATGSSTWECLGSSNCGGDTCCAFSSAGSDGGIYIAKDTSATAAPAACQPHYVSKIGGSKCASACAATGEFELCSSTDKCSDTSKKCVAATVTGGKQLGVCQ